MFKNKFSTLTRNKSKTYEEIHYTCTIRFLDDSVPITVTFQKDTKGQWLIDYVCKELNLVEKDYFGLRYVDSDKQRHWLDPYKSVYRQLKQCFRNEDTMSSLSNNADVNPMVLCFRVKFYPTDPMKLREEITRYFLFLQLRRDLHHGRLLCTPADANLLAAYIIQSEVGDYDPEDHPPGYVSEFKMLPKQTQKQEEKIAEIHKTLAGQVPAEAEANFLKKACTLDTYGVDPHPVKVATDNSDNSKQDQKGNQMYLGVTHLGIVTFQGNKRTHLFKWPQINKIAFEGKMFIVHVTMSEPGADGVHKSVLQGEDNSLSYKRKKHACGFKCPTFSACKHLWKCAVEQQYFFTLSASQEAPKVTSGGGIFTRGSKFRFSGRCQKEVYAESANIKRDPPQFVRSASNPQFVRSFNHVRSTSMPLRLKEKPTDDAMVTNHVSASELPLTGSHAGVQEVIEDTIPEEKAVPVSDVPYAPLDSPTKEDLPALPASSGLGPDAHSDLDAQIQVLQQELDKCRMADESSNHIQERPIDVEMLVPEKAASSKTEPAAPSATTSTTTTTTTNGPTEPAAATDSQQKPVADASKKPSRRKACCVATLVSLTVAFLILLAIFVLALESDLQVPVVRDIRGWPAVSDFKHNQYDPMKASIGQKVGGWFKT